MGADKGPFAAQTGRVFELPLSVPIVLLFLALVATGVTALRIRSLPDLPLEPSETPASVCLCIPARNEAAELGPALDSWLAQDLPGLRIVVVDDGSTDATPQILADRARRHPERLLVIRNDVLPPGWLGKNHALHLATCTDQARSADWLLFVDADVRADDPTLVRRALALVETDPTDVLALVPAVDTVSFWERLILPLGATAFLWIVPPSRVASPRSRVACGIGAFTLIRRTAYEAVGGHAAAPLEPVDDMMLARRAKVAGFQNRVACGGPWLHLRMYPGLAAFVRGLRKNAVGWPGTTGWALPGAFLILGLFASPLVLAFGGYPGWGLGLWLLVPAFVGSAHQRLSRRPMDPVWGFWPLVGLPLVAGWLWALMDRLRGVNHWRGRDVRLDSGGVGGAKNERPPGP